MRNNGASLASVTAELDAQVQNLDNMWTLATPSYSDQVLPFNVTLAGANEYGAMTAGKILGIEILNEVGLSLLPDNKTLAPRARAACPPISPLRLRRGIGKPQHGQRAKRDIYRDGCRILGKPKPGLAAWFYISWQVGVVL